MQVQTTSKAAEVNKKHKAGDNDSEIMLIMWGAIILICLVVCCMGVYLVYGKGNATLPDPKGPCSPDMEMNAVLTMGSPCPTREYRTVMKCLDW
jgi:hypothetical protein